MRFVLALLAMLAFLASPAMAMAASIECGHAQASPMAGMDMAGMGRTGQAVTVQIGHAPCCDPGSQHKKPSPACVAACAAICGVAVGLPASPHSFAFAFQRVRHATATLAAAHPSQQTRLERPPKSIA